MAEGPQLNVCFRKWTLTVNPRPLFCVLHVYPLTDQSCHTQAGTLNRKQTNNYKCFGSDADKYTWKHCMWTHTAKSSHVCTRTVSHMESSHIHTHADHTFTQACTHTSCVWLLPAFSPCMPTVCLASGLRSGATHKLCALPGFYTL